MTDLSKWAAVPVCFPVDENVIDHTARFQLQWKPSIRPAPDACRGVHKVILSKGIPWFDEYDDQRRALDHYLKPGNNSFVASPGSIAAALEGGALAIALGDKSAARHLWEAVIRSDCYAGDDDVIRTAKRRIAQIEAIKI